MHLSTGSSLFVTSRTRSECILLQVPLCLFQKEQLNQCASFYMILSVCYKTNEMSLLLSTWFSLFVTIFTRSALKINAKLLLDCVQRVWYLFPKFFKCHLCLLVPNYERSCKSARRCDSDTYRQKTNNASHGKDYTSIIKHWEL